MRRPASTFLFVLPLFTALLLGAVWLLGCSPATPELEPDDPIDLGKVFESFPAGTKASDMLAVIDEGLATPGRGPDSVRFILVRDGGRHLPAYDPRVFHIVIGAGREFETGSVHIQRRWNIGGSVHGRNEELDKHALGLAIEAGAPRPYADEIVASIREVVAAVNSRVPLHPDCIVSMNEVPYAHKDPVGPDEDLLVQAVRRGLPLPPLDRTLVVESNTGPIDVGVEVRDNNIGIYTGMMMRRSFGGDFRGMLFVYPHRGSRAFFMRNCFIPIAVAYIRKGVIDQIYEMAPQAGVPSSRIRRHESQSAIRYALEMPGGWFAKHGVEVGAKIDGLPQ